VESSIQTALTNQERALLAFARSAPEQAMRTFGQMQPNDVAPLSVDMIEIQPLPDQALGE
jgi:hypothetical protein